MRASDLLRVLALLTLLFTGCIERQPFDHLEDIEVDVEEDVGPDSDG